MKKENSEKGKTSHGILWAAGLAVLAAAVAGVFCWRKLPAMRVAKGVAGLVRELREYENPVLESVDWRALADRAVTKGFRGTLSGSGRLPEREKEAFGLETELLLDRQEKKLSMTTDSRLLGFDLGRAEVFGDEKTIYLAFPDLLQERFWIGTEDFGARYQDSIWNKYLKWEVDPGERIELFPDWGSGRLKETGSKWDERLRKWEQGIGNVFLLACALDVKPLSDEGENSYRVRISKELLNRWLGALEEETAEGLYGEKAKAFLESLSQKAGASSGLRLAEDVELRIVLEEGRIVRAETLREAAGEGNGWKLGAAFAFSGEERVLDRIDGSITLYQGEGSSELVLARRAGQGAEFREENWEVTWTPDRQGDAPSGSGADAQADGRDVPASGIPAGSFAWESRWDFPNRAFTVDVKRAPAGKRPQSVSVSGRLSDAEADGSLVLQIDSLTFALKSNALAEVSGTLSIEPLEEKITMPEGGIDFLGMREKDVLKIVLGMLLPVWH